MRILFVTSEFNPFAKSGGLADAVAALAKVLAARGHRVTVVMPHYPTVAATSDTLTELGIPVGVPLGYAEEWVGLYYTAYHGVDVYFIDHWELFRRDGIYGPTPSTAYADNLRRMALLSRGALQIALALDLRPDIIHAHDWPSALTPVYHRYRYSTGDLSRAATVFSIHNFGYQGWWPRSEAPRIGLDDRELNASGIAINGAEINLVRGAISTAHKIVPVSPQYAREIQTSTFGFGLHREIAARRRDVSGILNGIDQDEWDPAGDPFIAATFDANRIRGKAICKRAIQSEFGLPPDPDVPIVGMITRLTEQKGIGALFGPGYGSLYRICRELPLQFVLLGTGEEWCQDEIRALSTRLPNFHAVIGYSDPLAHRINAGVDFFLMPSTYEPCGLNQMYAMRYGTLPVVTRTGGLYDTVDESTGFLIPEYSPESIFLTVRRAITLYQAHPEEFRRMQRRAMRRDFTWDRSAETYESLYRSVVAPGVSRPLATLRRNRCIR